MLYVRNHAQGTPLLRKSQNINPGSSLGSMDSEFKMKASNDPHWVLARMVTAHTGYTDDAIRAKKRRGEWREGIHWRKAPDNRIVFNLTSINRWMGGLDV